MNITFPISEALWQPGSQNTYKFTIANTTLTQSTGLLELENLDESLNEFSKYLLVTIQEETKETASIISNVPLQTLYTNGFTKLTTIPANQEKTYTFSLLLDDQTPSEFQEQSITFDIKIGLETMQETVMIYQEKTIKEIVKNEENTTSSSPEPMQTLTQLKQETTNQTRTESENLPTPQVLGESTQSAENTSTKPLFQQTFQVFFLLLFLVICVSVLFFLRIRNKQH